MLDNFMRAKNKSTPTPTPTINPEKKDPVTFYSIGITDDNRISFSLGAPPYNKTIIMNEVGVQGLINMLTSSLDLLEYDNDITDELEEPIKDDSEDGC